MPIRRFGSMRLRRRGAGGFVGGGRRRSRGGNQKTMYRTVRAAKKR